jgi:hypothetical protein
LSSQVDKFFNIVTNKGRLAEYMEIVIEGPRC